MNPFPRKNVSPLKGKIGPVFYGFQIGFLASFLSEWTFRKIHSEFIFINKIAEYLHKLLRNGLLANVSVFFADEHAFAIAIIRCM